MAPMNCGILVIGSLLWEDGPRDAWRQDRLQLHKSQTVSAPIRYGRRSTKRANTFTMVLDPTAPPGQAVLVPCVRRIETVSDLIEEAEALWRAERSKTASGGICARWGCVGALFRGDDVRDANVAKDWNQYFRSACAPVAPVDHDGTLRIPWPALDTDGAPAAVGVILATATQAEVRRPTPSQIADAWIEQDQGEERYFFRNVQSGIRTAEDQAIAQRIITCSPTWMGSDSYAPVLANFAFEDGPRSLNPS
jgi:hypothetical protein